MKESHVETLFGEFARSYLRGEKPEMHECLERAGSDREELGRMLDRFLQAVPAREPTEEEVVLMQARLEQEPPLLVLRLRRKLSRGAVVDAIVRRLELDPAKREKVAGYYHELEVGTLDPKPVSSRLWDALGEFLDANVRVLAGIRLEPKASAGVYLRETRHLASWVEVADSLQTDFARREIRTPAPEPERDEIDSLFTAGD